MDLQKEREAFEKECKLLCYKGNMVVSNLGNFYNNDQTNWMWQMWLSSKNQAIPEGFVLVPIETLDEALSWANCASNESWSDEHREEIDKHYRVIERAMIEAREPAND